MTALEHLSDSELQKLLHEARTDLRDAYKFGVGHDQSEKLHMQLDLMEEEWDARSTEAVRQAREENAAELAAEYERIM